MLSHKTRHITIKCLYCWPVDRNVRFPFSQGKSYVQQLTIAKPVLAENADYVFFILYHAYPILLITSRKDFGVNVTRLAWCSFPLMSA